MASGVAAPSAFAAFAAFAVTAVSAAASAEPPGPQTARLVWVRGERTESCDDGAAVAHRVATRLGRDVFSDAAPRSIEGVVTHDGAHWEARLYLRDARGALVGSRDLTSDAPDCEPLEAAATLAIALAIDPDAALRPLPSPDAASPTAAAAPAATAAPPLALPPAPPSVPTPSSVPTPPPAHPPPAPPPEVSRTAEPLPPQPPRNAVRVTARAVLGTGILPSASPGFAWSAEAPAERVLVGSAGVLYFPEVRTAARDFAFGLTAAWLGACAQAWGGRPVSLAVCAKVLLGALHAVVYQLEPTEPGDRFWSGASLAGQARFRIVGPLVLEVGGELLVPITRQRFMVSGQSAPVFQESAAGVAGFAGLGVSIP